MGCKHDKDHWSTGGRKAWTIAYVITWVLLFIGLIVYHVAIAKVVPPLVDLPANLAEGFDDIFKFKDLESASIDNKKQSKDALAMCSADGTLPCPSPVPGTSPSDNTEVNTKTQKDKIIKNFEVALNQVRKVCEDKYLGTDDLRKTGDLLGNMTKTLDDIPINDSPCFTTNPLYCTMWKQADETVKTVKTVNDEIDKFKKSDLVQKWEDNASYLNYLNALPYILVISAIFFFFLWFFHGGCVCLCCCKEGSPGCSSCLFIIPHVLFWLVFFVINSIIVALGIVIPGVFETEKMKVGNGDPTILEFCDHLKEVYPEFWKKVFADMEDGLIGMFRAALVFELFCIVIIMYGCCMCCWRPFRNRGSKVVDEEAAKPAEAAYIQEKPAEVPAQQPYTENPVQQTPVTVVVVNQNDA